MALGSFPTSGNLSEICTEIPRILDQGFPLLAPLLAVLSRSPDIPWDETKASTPGRGGGTGNLCACGLPPLGTEEHDGTPGCCGKTK